MKRTLPGLAAVCLSLTLCHAATELTFEKDLNVGGAVNLDLITDSGGIEVTRGAPGAVHIRGILRASHGWFEGAGDVQERMQRLQKNPPIQQSGSTIRIGYVSDKWLLKGISLRLEISAPPDAQVQAKVDSGGIRVDGVKGPVECKADSGGIDIAHADAEVHASTDSGGIHIHDIRGPVFARADSGGIDALDIHGSIDVSTDSGGIHMSQTSAAPVKAHADSGGASLKLAPGSGYDLKIHSDSGRIQVAEMTVHGTISEHHYEGTVRGGGPRVDIDVDSGNIDIE
jgi:hypothetical protein